MTRLEQKLKDLGEGFPEDAVHGAPAMPRVVKRGRVRRAFTQGVAGVAASALLVGGAVAAPRLLDGGPDTPVILGQVDEGRSDEPKVERTADVDRDEERDAEREDVRKDELAKRHLADEAALKRHHDRATDAKPVTDVAPDEKPVTDVAPDTEPQPKPLPPEPKPEPKPEPPVADWRFTANQRASVVEGNPPVNGYWGTGKPGTQVKVWSDYGHVYADVDRQGHWETRLAFTGAPAGRTTLRVTVFHKATDHQKSFELTTMRPEPDWRFTANQRASVVEGNPPVNGYWGTGKPGTQVKVWSDYGHVYADVDRQGHWETRLAFTGAPAGRTTFRVTVFHKATDHQKSFELTTVRPEPDWRFTANQRASVVEGNPPVNGYWGTGKPGTQVKVYSEYGWIYTEVDREGHWETRLAFENAPAGEKTFRVTVFHKATDHQKSFELTTVRPADRPSDSAFTVTWGREASAEDLPYQDASGTAKPGSKVLLWSEYGSTVVTVGSDGRWAGRVSFPDAPRGQRAVFDIKARSEATGEAIWFRGFVTERPA